MLKVCEIFRSIQGEGVHAGEPTIFIRLSGCNLKCAWCDTQYHDEGREISVGEVIDEVEMLFDVDNILPLICITGGEPLLQSGAAKLAAHLILMGYDVSIETNGTQHPFFFSDLGDHQLARLSYSVDFKLPSSGQYKPENILTLTKFDRPHNSIKFVISSNFDYEVARDFVRQYWGFDEGVCKILFSPCSGGEISPTELANRIINEQLPVRLSLQLHKILWGNERGV